MPLQGSQGLAQRETFKNGEVSIHSSKLSDQFLRIFHFSAWCCLCRISAVMGRRFRQFSPSTKKIVKYTLQKDQLIIKVIFLSTPWFPTNIEKCYRCSSFFIFNRLQKKTKLILEAKWASAFAHHICVLKCNSSWVFTGKLQILEKKMFSVWSPNAVFLGVAQQYCCAFNPLFLRCRKCLLPNVAKWKITEPV